MYAFCLKLNCTSIKRQSYFSYGHRIQLIGIFITFCHSMKIMAGENLEREFSTGA